MPIRKSKFNTYVRKIEESNSIKNIDKIERMINEDLGGNPDTWTLDFYYELSDLADKKRAKLEKMSK